MTDFAHTHGPWAVVAGASDGTGGAFPDVASSEDVVREGLDHLGDGPTWSHGMPDPQGPSPFAPLPRRQAVELMTQASAAMHNEPPARR